VDILVFVTSTWTLRPASADDAQWIADLKAVAMRPDLERLGLWNRDWARQRFLDTYVPANTAVIEVDDKPVESIAVRPEADAQWIEHFYLDPAVQGRGIGGQVLQHMIDTHRDTRPFRLALDRGSAARRLYERVGFTYLYDDSNDVDQIFGLPGQDDGNVDTHITN
jgi:GNAT superfamily N-acetyltransferase